MKNFLTTALLVAAISGCSSQASPGSEAPPAPSAAPTTATAPAPPAAPAAAAVAADPAADAKQIFATRCTPCHGATGAGDGPASAGLTPKPAAFTTAEWQAKVTDEHIEKIIAYGGMAVGKAATMPPNPDLDGKPVIPELRKLIRGMKP
jgi:high-affinity iron transporter